MRIVVSKAETEFASFVRALEQDPSSWNGWLCLHIHIEPRRDFESYLSPMGYVISDLGDHIQHLDGTTYIIGSSNLFIVCRHIETHKLRNIASDIAYSLMSQFMIAASYRLYEADCEWRQLNEFCTDLGCWKFPGDTVRNRAAELNALCDMDDIHTILEENIRHRRKHKPATIMLVEDDLLTCRLVGRLLKNDYKLITAHNAQEAVRQYALHAPDLVFLDIGLPDRSGFEVLRSIAACDPEAYFVMFSSNSYAENITRSLHEGAKGFVEKPFRKERLDHYIAEWNALQHPAIRLAVD